MRIVDLTQVFNESISIYPGGEAPLIKDISSVKEDGVALKSLTLDSHMGTHMDAPSHMIENGRTLDQYSPSDFMGKALVIDVTHLTERIGFEDVLPFGPWLRDVKFVFFKTGWSKRWGTPEYGQNYPALTKKAANWLCEQRVRGIGIDTLSIDGIDSTDFPVHKILLRCEMIIIENLTNLDQLPEYAFDVACLPMKIENADGAPARVVAMLND